MFGKSSVEMTHTTLARIFLRELDLVPLLCGSECRDLIHNACPVVYKKQELDYIDN